jgi:hypothetical protein
VHGSTGDKVPTSCPCTHGSTRRIREIALTEIIWLIHEAKTTISQVTFGRKFDECRQIVVCNCPNLEPVAADGVYEFAFIGGSLKLRGADAAPLRPIAIPVK